MNDTLTEIAPNLSAFNPGDLCRVVKMVPRIDPPHRGDYVTVLRISALFIYARCKDGSEFPFRVNELAASGGES